MIPAAFILGLILGLILGVALMLRVVGGLTSAQALSWPLWFAWFLLAAAAAFAVSFRRWPARAAR